MKTNNGDTLRRGRVAIAAPATAQAAASGQHTEKSASHAHQRDPQRITDTDKNQSILYKTGQNGGN